MSDTSDIRAGNCLIDPHTFRSAGLEDAEPPDPALAS